MHLTSLKGLTSGQEVTPVGATGTCALSAKGGAGRLGPAVVSDRTYLGNAVEYHLKAGPQTLTVRAPRGGLRGTLDFAPGAQVFVTLGPDAPKVLTT